MYDELKKRLRDIASHDSRIKSNYIGLALLQAADAIEKLSARVDSLQFFADSISKLPDCNTCLKNTMCEFMPNYGEYCRINCPAWVGQPLKEETK